MGNNLRTKISHTLFFLERCIIANFIDTNWNFIKMTFADNVDNTKAESVCMLRES